ncbi:uncharacterized protein EV420DRAFT_1589131 [Desarmillaria tabescens]|uniref:Uncharacterized protein n=1 Tax=Armillaria tabescens TaxID=1929756 RepID=A0AA39J6M1_ARMTA|nr:uncharacterized protein EV420DRAFT_1589131 [Desarmillaria tabescens]KAK0437107.1 hypothetical protein EV420DRAFT_1589131 [Desarmillaria tabescens]
MHKRYCSRTLNYAWGLKDNGNGDTGCQAQTQGRTHLERGQNSLLCWKIWLVSRISLPSIGYLAWATMLEV